VESILGRLTPLAVRYRVGPFLLTSGGAILSALAGFFYALGFVVAGGVVTGLSGICDMLDGAVARATGRSSAFGAFADSVTDRYADLFLLGGILAWFARQGDLGGSLLALAALSGAYLTSYTRARAELSIPSCSIGIMERPERILVLVAGSLMDLLIPALWVLAILGHLTALQRIHYTRKALKQRP